MATHFAAVHEGRVLGTRSSTSRHAEGTGRFGLYTHAVVRTLRIVTLDGDRAESVTWQDEVTTWHGGPANAQTGLRAARVGTAHCYSATGCTWVEDPTRKHGVRNLTTDDPATARIVTVERATLAPVVVTTKKPKIGQFVVQTDLGGVPLDGGRGERFVLRLSDDAQAATDLPDRYIQRLIRDWQFTTDLQAATVFTRERAAAALAEDGALEGCELAAVTLTDKGVVLS